MKRATQARVRGWAHVAEWMRAAKDPKTAHREQEQLTAAIAYERDPERREIAADLQRASFQKGVL